VCWVPTTGRASNADGCAELARDYLHRTTALEVVGGVLSPVHDAYGKRDLLPGTHRVAMCQCAVRASDWITVSDWEVQQSGWTRTRQVLEQLAAQVNAERPRKRPIGTDRHTQRDTGRPREMEGLPATAP
jgi:nicotinic acid mononucleotide adenylyltransferase